MEDGSQNAKNTNKNAISGVKKNQITALVALVIVLAVAWGIYSLGVSKGKDKAAKDAKIAALKNAATNPLLALPASGEVSKVSDKSVTIKLLGNETNTATIDKSTQITDKNGAAKVSDIKVGGKAIIFTKKSGDGLVATKIILQ